MDHLANGTQVGYYGERADFYGMRVSILGYNSDFGSYAVVGPRGRILTGVPRESLVRR